MLTNAQAQALKTEIANDAALASQPNNGVGEAAIAEALNALAAPAFPVWRTNVQVQEIFDAINWALYTPVDLVDGTGMHQERLLLIQTKQMNLQNMLMGRFVIDASKANVRAGLRDAVIQIPAGSLGANVSPGGASGANVLNVMTRNATRAEKVLILPGGVVATGAVSASLLGFEGEITSTDVNQARNAP
jgi:hypothetical protein